MGVDLLKHNQEAYEKIQKAIKEGKKKIAIAHATGTGKSYLITKLFEDFNNDKKLVLVPSTYISDQIQTLFEKYNIQNVDIMRYQKLIKMSDEDIAAMDYDVIALDEYHHDTSKVWGNKVKTLIESHSESIIFGTSATPVRSDGVNTIDELFEGNCASDLPLSESVAKKIVPLPKYVGALYKLDDELERLRKKVEQATNTKEEKQEFYKKIDLMRSQIEKSYGMPIILNKHIKDKEGKYLVFCKKKRHLQEIKETVIGWFRTAGCKNINAYEVYSDYENKDAEYKAFCEDTSHNLKLLFCVNMLNEGLHLENISGVLLLRPTRSSIVWHQQIGRAIEANNTNTPVIIDAVNNFSAVGQGMELMREIKDAVAKEKESDPDFDDSRFEDIDTFFVLEQVVEIQEMFKEIEERLIGDWDAMFREYCKFYGENGHGDVPKTKQYRRLNTWCKNQRNNLDNGVLQAERKQLLDESNFIWDVLKYRFEKNVFDCIAFYEKKGRLPSACSENKEERELMGRIYNYKGYMSNYPQWKQDLLKMIPDLFDEKASRFDKFYNMALIYKQKYGHVSIENNDVIGEYKIGRIYNLLIYDYKIGKLTDEQIRKLSSLGIDVTVGKSKKRYDDKIQLAQQALSEGIVLSKKNRIYKGVDLYKWYYSHKSSLSKEQLNTFKKIICEHKKTIKVVDLLNKQTNIYSSITKVAETLYSEFNVTENDKSAMYSILHHLSGKVATPYKGRFMFYYATDEEVKKYLEENKASQL